VRLSFSFVDGGRMYLERDSRGSGSRGWLKSISLVKKLIIIESVCVRVG